MDPWEIRPNNNRALNTKKTFIIFCEDEAVEPAYFELFRNERNHISAIGNSKQHHAQVDNATEYFRDNDLIDVDKEGNEFLKIDADAQVWCVFDRDKNENDQKDTAFNDSIATANRKGIRTAWSNDDFELWILLHFEEVDPSNDEYSHRSKYYERLTEILRKLEPIGSKVHSPRFDYYTSMKTKKRFIECTYQHMKGKVEKAIQRAEALEAFHTQTPKAKHLQCPCTMVHHLVKELLSE